MERLTWKAPNGTYQIDDCSAVSSPVSRTTCYDENFKNAFTIYEGSAIDKLGKYEDLEEQGLLLKLPCKVGDKVFHGEIDYAEGFVLSGEIKSISVEKEQIWLYCHYEDGLNYWHTINDLGKTVFLTKEEAEQALERRRDGTD